MGLHILGESEKCMSDGRDTIEMMKEATHFMSETLNDVLSIEKIEEGKLQLQYDYFSVCDMMNTVRLSMRGQVTAKNMHLQCHIEDLVPKILYGDRFRIEHVLANLLSNAIKFSPQKSTIKIVITVIETSASIEVDFNGEDKALTTYKIKFAVIDQGVGISEENLKKLFTPYAQFNARELQKGGGTGVGTTPLSRRKLMHSSVTIHSPLPHHSLRL